MSPTIRIRHRLSVVLQMVMALITAVLLGQLWLFTVTLEAMEDQSVSMNVVIVTAACSLAACISVWVLIRFFWRTERAETGEPS